MIESGCKHIYLEEEKISFFTKFYAKYFDQISELNADDGKVFFKGFMDIIGKNISNEIGHNFIIKNYKFEKGKFKFVNFICQR